MNPFAISSVRIFHICRDSKRISQLVNSPCPEYLTEDEYVKKIVKKRYKLYDYINAYKSGFIGFCEADLSDMIFKDELNEFYTDDGMHFKSFVSKDLSLKCDESKLEIIGKHNAIISYVDNIINIKPVIPQCEKILITKSPIDEKWFLFVTFN